MTYCREQERIDVTNTIPVGLWLQSYVHKADRRLTKQ